MTSNLAKVWRKYLNASKRFHFAQSENDTKMMAH